MIKKRGGGSDNIHLAGKIAMSVFILATFVAILNYYDASGVNFSPPLKAVKIVDLNTYNNEYLAKLNEGVYGLVSVQPSKFNPTCAMVPMGIPKVFNTQNEVGLNNFLAYMMTQTTQLTLNQISQIKLRTNVNMPKQSATTMVVLDKTGTMVNGRRCQYLYN